MTEATQMYNHNRITPYVHIIILHRKVSSTSQLFSTSPVKINLCSKSLHIQLIYFFPFLFYTPKVGFPFFLPVIILL